MPGLKPGPISEAKAETGNRKQIEAEALEPRDRRFQMTLAAAVFTIKNIVLFVRNG
jgi:hypothetical protein